MHAALAAELDLATRAFGAERRRVIRRRFANVAPGSRLAASLEAGHAALEARIQSGIGSSNARIAIAVRGVVDGEVAARTALARRNHVRRPTGNRLRGCGEGETHRDERDDCEEKLVERLHERSFLF